MRKKIFFLNMVMMVLSMFTLFFVTTGFIRSEIHSYLISGDWISDIDTNIVNAEEILKECVAESNTDWESIETQLEQYGYKLCVYDGENVLLSPTGEDAETKELLENLGKNETAGMHMAFGVSFVDIQMQVEGQQYYLVAFYANEDALHGNWNESGTDIFIYKIAGLGLVTIAVLIFIGWFFSKHIVKRITVPLDILIQSLKKAGQGDNSARIEYHDEKEFEVAYEAFNRMQEDIGNHEHEREEYEKKRTDMVTSISHDLRTPLTAIKGYIKAVLDGMAKTPEKQTEYLTIAYESTGEMDQLLQKLFLFSKIETGKMPLDLVPLEMAEYLSKYVEKRKKQYAENEVEIRLFLPPIIWEGNYDALQMQRIFDNLLENSVRYAGKNPIKVIIILHETDDNEVITFMDNGNGVPEEKIPYIFDRFYRCDDARGQDGNGVGLYIVKYIVEALNGKVIAGNIRSSSDLETVAMQKNIMDLQNEMDEGGSLSGFFVQMSFPKGGLKR